MTTERSLNSNNKGCPQDKTESVPEEGDIDYAGILARTLEHSFIRPKGITLADVGLMITAKPFEATEKKASGSTVQDDNNLFNLEAELSRKRHEAEVERKKTGKHIRLREG